MEGRISPTQTYSDHQDVVLGLALEGEVGVMQYLKWLVRHESMCVWWYHATNDRR